MKVLVSFIVTILVACCPAIPQSGKESLNIDLATIGRVYLKRTDSTFVGSAFSAGEQGNVYMAAHEALADTMWYRPFRRGADKGLLLKIVLKYRIGRYDLAVYGHPGGVAESLPFGRFALTRPGDEVLYLGWEGNTLLKPHLATVIAQGKHWHKGEQVEFIDVRGRGLHGYSGGPVINLSGEVIGVISTGWDKECESDSTKFQIVRAHSLDLFRILDSHTIHALDTALSGSKLESILMK